MVMKSVGVGRAASLRLRVVLAALLSIALVLGLVHCPMVDGVPEATRYAASQHDAGGHQRAPCPVCPPGDHCLTHVAAVLLEPAGALGLVTAPHTYRSFRAEAPPAPDHAAPFKPPRLS
jgi:hypothetical protein